ncbi:50S ribosomal protein L18 [Larkinella terrae]|uniref:Large ribosomal subunit protein uL18 n=1 Tax=Larkinella terrae TaxID=2025311 RepID=A0A7K0EIH4_9BACT|nr:50S ribosomal protein L18 [Larkinella terrae]MRS61391.1 50S ribosomal protein L18 [Larkinella terrae]
MAVTKASRRLRIKNHIRNKVSGTADQPRLSVFRSNARIYAQIIDDEKGHTLVSASSIDINGKDKKGVNVELAKQVGQALAEKATTSGITRVVFDRNGYLYHGKVKALADGAREGGLQF